MNVEIERAEGAAWPLVRLELLQDKGQQRSRLLMRANTCQAQPHAKESH